MTRHPLFFSCFGVLLLYPSSSSSFSLVRARDIVSMRRRNVAGRVYGGAVAALAAAKDDSSSPSSPAPLSSSPTPDHKDHSEERVSSPELGQTPPTPPWPVLGALLFVYVNNQWSRSLIYYLVSFSDGASGDEFMNVGLGFDQTQYSILASFGFTALFAVSSLLAGSVTDRNDRALLTAGSCFVWGLATIATAFAPSFAFVFFFRVIQGISQGFTTPAAYGLLADVFPPEKGSTANSVYSSGIYFGGALASLSAVLVRSVGWRGTCAVVGGLSIVAAVLSLFLVQDPRASSSSASSASSSSYEPSSSSSLSSSSSSSPLGEDDSSSLLGAVADVLRSRVVVWLFAASALRFCAGFGIGVWSAPFFRQQFPDDQASFALANAAVVAVGGFLSSLAGGRIADALAPPSTSTAAAVAATAVEEMPLMEETEEETDPGARAWFLATSCALAVPAWAMVVTAASFPVAMGLLFVEYLVAECWFGPAVSVLQEHVAPSRRGTAQGLFSVLTTVGNVAPVVIGAALSAKFELRDALLYSIPAFYALAGACFVFMGLELRADMPKELPQK